MNGVNPWSIKTNMANAKLRLMALARNSGRFCQNSLHCTNARCGIQQMHNATTNKNIRLESISVTVSTLTNVVCHLKQANQICHV